ncbi:protein phosphatase 2C domain-containing protein [Streptomyces sp. NBC_01420]|uniref:PP2C family protein-serine/threonine phosphatase n=1 Tax=Streptomyces sp. NBC_01420 TaxID=2903858 RepID=UPI0032526463
MRNYATAQQTGTDPIQCDATAVSTAPDGTRAYVLLDGIGRSESVREWTRAAARRLARAASRRGDAEAGLRHVYNRYALERAPHGAGPKAAAVVAVVTPGKLTVAWCGDSRAYLITDGLVEKLTNDHNLRRVYPPNNLHSGGNRNRITSCLGSSDSDEDVLNTYGHPAIEALTRPMAKARLVLASDGAYEPIEDGGYGYYDAMFQIRPSHAARALTAVAVDHAECTSRGLDPARVYADNATALVADLQP